MFKPQKSRNEIHSVGLCPKTGPSAQQGRPFRNDGAEENIECFAANPCLNPKPAARNNCPHQRRQIRSVGAVGRARENREGNAVLCARMRVEQDRNQHDRVAQQNRDQRLPPVHARADQPRREHVRRNTMRHADPQRRIVVGGPVALRDRDRRQVRVVERT